MSKRRRSWTHKQADDVLAAWIRKRGFSQKEFIDFLDERGVTITRQTCSALFMGRITPGPMFKRVFKEITGITLVNGLIEEE